MKGPPSQWSEAQVRAMHAYYISHPEMSVRDVAEHFAVSLEHMYELFEDHHLWERREGQPSTARWMRLTREQVEEMYALYLAGTMPVDQVPLAWGIKDVEMYDAFKRFDLPSVRNQMRRGVTVAADRCPAMRMHEYCPHCTCPAPRCVEGHLPAEEGEPDEGPVHRGGFAAVSDDWHCGTCRLKARKCVCWSPAQRTACGFDEAYASWQEERRGEMEKVRRLRQVMRSRRAETCPL